MGGALADIGYQAVPRDAFPVFDNPTMISAAEAEKRGIVFDRAAVIGIAHNGEAKAYPISHLNRREMVVDSLAGLPILVTW